MLPCSPMDNYSWGYAFILHLRPYHIGYSASLNISFGHSATKLHNAPSRLDDRKPVLCSPKRFAFSLPANRHTSHINDTLIPSQVSTSS